MSEESLFEQRVEKTEALRALGIDPYANDFRVDTQVADFVRSYQRQDKEALSQVQ